MVFQNTPMALAAALPYDDPEAWCTPELAAKLVLHHRHILPFSSHERLPGLLDDLFLFFWDCEPDTIARLVRGLRKVGGERFYAYLRGRLFDLRPQLRVWTAIDYHTSWSFDC